MSSLVSKPCYRNRKSTLCHNRTEVILFEHAVFKQSTQGKGEFVIRSWSLFLHRVGGDGWAPGKIAEPGQIWTIQELLQECELCISPQLDWSWTEEEGGCCATWGMVGNPEQHQGRGLRLSSWWSKKERKAACSCTGVWGRWSGTAVTQLCVCQMSHFFMRLLGSEWFLSKRYVSSWQERKKLCHFVAVAYVIPGNSCSKGAGINLRNKWERQEKELDSCLPLTKASSPLARWWG